jgi:hypothetical protein
MFLGRLAVRAIGWVAIVALSVAWSAPCLAAASVAGRTFRCPAAAHDYGERTTAQAPCCDAVTLAAATVPPAVRISAAAPVPVAVLATLDYPAPNRTNREPDEFPSRPKPPDPAYLLFATFRL